MSNIFKNYLLVKVIHLLIRCYKTRFFPRSTNDTDRNGVNKQNTHTHTHTHTPRLHWKGLVSMKTSDTLAFFKIIPAILPTPPFL